MSEAIIDPPGGGTIGSALMERVMNAVPVSQPAFAKLLSLLDIRLSDRVSTACVTLGGRSRLLLNPDFIAAHCRTDEALAMLVMHELLHVLLGHTRLFERLTPAHNFAFDALINAQLCLLYPHPAGTALFRNLYPEDELPWALLRPPAGWGGRRMKWRLKGEAGRLHRQLYTDTSVTTTELFELLKRLFADGPTPSPEAGTLLGNHGDDVEPGAAPDPDMVREIRDIVARWPMTERRSGRDDGGELSSEQVRVARARREAVAVIRRALWPLLGLEQGDGPLSRRSPVETRVSLPYRTGLDRRAEVQALMGWEPLFFQGRSTDSIPDRRQRAHVYVDVSGSMGGELPLIYGALLPLLDRLHPRIHLFSTQVEDIGPADLKRGVVATAWGTDIGCVTGHLLEQGVQRALIVTDGWVGSVPGDHRVRLARRKVRVHCVVTWEGETEFASAFRGGVSRLPRLI